MGDRGRPIFAPYPEDIGIIVLAKPAISIAIQRRPIPTPPIFRRLILQPD